MLECVRLIGGVTLFRGMFHADYYADPRNVISAIVYTGHASEEPLVGGWTGFVDNQFEEGGPPVYGLE